MSPERDPTPALIGVIDLMRGQVVRAIGGRRERYRRWISPLTASSDPIEVAHAFRARYGIQRLYVADLDALEGREADQSVVPDLVAAGFHVVLDAGPSNSQEIAAALSLGAARVVLPLERLFYLAALAAWRRDWDKSRLVFGLDLDEGLPRAPFDGARRYSLTPPGGSGLDRGTESALAVVDDVWRFGLRQLIVLDLAAVGGQRGLATLELCRTIHRRWPEMTIWTGGGLENQSDVVAAGKAGVDGLLVATALHEQQIEPR